MNRATALKKLKASAARLAQAEAGRDSAVAAAMQAGCTWAEIGPSLGVSAQAAHRRFRFLHHNPTTGEVWREPPLSV